MDKVVINKDVPKLWIFTAFACLYIIWGSTYLAIMIAIKSIPPFFLVAARFIVAGLALYGWCLFKGEKAPSLKTSVITGIGGVLMLFVGNGAVTWAEQYLPSGVAAIVVATVPLWFIMLDKRQWSFHFSNKGIVIGICIGFAGVLLLFSGKGSSGTFTDKMKLISFFVLIAGTIGWAIGSLYSKYKHVETSVTMKAALQMIAAGVFSAIVGFCLKEHQGFALGKVSGQSIAAACYLVLFGSLVGYMSYIWLLSVRPPSVVGTYAYINPVVAVFLGWLIINEPITLQQIIALAVILGGVILVNFSRDKV